MSLFDVHLSAITTFIAHRYCILMYYRLRMYTTEQVTLGDWYCRATRRLGTRAGRRALSVRGPTTGFVDVVQV